MWSRLSDPNDFDADDLVNEIDLDCRGIGSRWHSATPRFTSEEYDRFLEKLVTEAKAEQNRIFWTLRVTPSAVAELTK